MCFLLSQCCQLQTSSRTRLSWRSLTVEQWRGFCIAGNTEESQCCRNAEFVELKCELTPDQSALYDAAVSVWQVCTLAALPLNSMVKVEEDKRSSHAISSMVAPLVAACQMVLLNLYI